MVRKIDLPDVTLMLVTSVRLKEAVWALKYSSKGIRFHSVKLLTDKDVLEAGIETVKIPRLDYDGYSRFIIYELHKYFETPFVLLIQDDGYVVHPGAWDEDFLRYDYIGAPWPIPEPDDVAYRDKDGNIRRVGNGGFSLRSHRLCRLASELDLPWDPYHGNFHEDGFICTKNVGVYEAHGCRIAPVNVAVRFSQETIIPEASGVKPFGFHGKYSRYNRRWGKRVKAGLVRNIKKIRGHNGL